MTDWRRLDEQWVHYHMGDLHNVVGARELARSPQIQDALKVPDAVYPVRRRDRASSSRHRYTAVTPP